MEQQQQTPEATAPAASSALHRKTHAGQAEHQARAMTLQKALRVSVAKVADDLCDMAMAAIGIRRQTCKASALEAHLDGNKLLMLLEGPLQRRGAAVIDPIVVGGLIQQQTMGKVLASINGDSRVLTATDAAICAPFIDALLARAGALPEKPDERILIDGYAFGARCEEPRLLMMALDEPEYEVVHLTLDLAGGVRQGQVVLCFPVISVQDRELSTEPNAQRSEKIGPTAPALEAVVMGLNVDLAVAIARVRMPLSEVQALKTGDLLDLEVSSFYHAIVQTTGGRRLSRGTLGQIDGTRALQLEHAASPVTTPRRRVADRAELDLPTVSGDGTGTLKEAVPDIKQLQKPEPPLEELSAKTVNETVTVVADLPKVPDLPDLADLPDLPDMSDLPGFDSDAGPAPYLGD